jgi:hypothetical protein
VDDGQPVGFAVPVVVQATDPDGISTVSLYYRAEGSPGFTFTFMSNEGTGDESVYVAEIPAEYVIDPGVDWYVRATDGLSGCREENFAPEDAPESFFHFDTQLDLQALPFYEDFTPEDGLCEGTDLERAGAWTQEIGSFPQALHAWRLEDRSPLSPDCSVSHSEGVLGGFWECPPPDGEGTIKRQNLLISPPVDFRDKSQIAVRWFEREVDGGICSESHQLWISTGSPDLSAGDWVALATLPMPSGGNAWASSDWYDLSVYAGEEQVYVGLFYEGGSAGRWQLDDFYVGEPIADLQLQDAGPLDESVQPGSTDIVLPVSIVNASDEYASTSLVATLTTADPDLEITGATATLPGLDPSESASVSPDFVFDVKSSHPDNAWLDFAVVLDDGLGHVWSVPLRLLMGVPSTATIAYTAGIGGDLLLELGHGLPEGPEFLVNEDSDGLAGAPWTLDVTEEAASLPPGPGLRRWFVRATNDGDSTASVDGLLLNVGGVDYSAADVPTLVEPGATAIVYLPPPPALSVEAWSTVPDPAAPGGQVSVSGLTLRNDGSDTAGPLACVMGSSNPDASGFSSSPVTFGTSPLLNGESRAADDSFTFDLASSHNDNSPVPLVLLCLDGADTMEISLDLPVPYAHPVVELFLVDDSDCFACDDDGMADPAEAPLVQLRVVNDGAFATDGPLTAELSPDTAASTAAFTFAAGSGDLSFGSDPLDPASSVTSDDAFEIAVDAAALLGDSMCFDVVLMAGDDEWQETACFDVTDSEWLPCPQTEDWEDDVLGSGDFDIQSCEYRSDDVMLQVRLHSWESFNTAIAFVDFFFYEVPNQFSIESVSGGADFEEGCVFGDDLVESVPIAVELVSEGDEEGDQNSATVRVAVADLGIIGHNTQVAFGSGSCPDVYFCDVWPDWALLFNIAEGTYFCDGSSFIPINW